ncbi:5,6-dimethylbenzimidazole synthase [Geodia barretti]|nr:5,6-dimethylbenzimidazole synthase [Geodia barretti]
MFGYSGMIRFLRQTLARIIQAAHHGPSVGFMQPWDFIIVGDTKVRGQVKDLFDRERQAAAQFFDEPRRSQYLELKLEGIMESPVNLCITCDPTRADEVLGRNSMPETDVYSTCCAVQNLWLAARSEGVGVGWVSILKTPSTAAAAGHTTPHHPRGLSLPRISGRIRHPAVAPVSGLAGAPAASRSSALRRLGCAAGLRYLGRSAGGVDRCERRFSRRGTTA